MIKSRFSFILKCKRIPLFLWKWPDCPPDRLWGLKLLEALWLQQQVFLKEIRRLGEAEHPCCAVEAPSSASGACVRPYLMQRVNLKWGVEKTEGVARFVMNALYTLYYETTYLMANIILTTKCIYFGFELIFVHFNVCVLNRVLWDE